MGVTNEIAFIKARRLQELLPEGIKGAIWVRAVGGAIVIRITTEELGTCSWRIYDVIGPSASDMALSLLASYRQMINDRFFR